LAQRDLLIGVAHAVQSEAFAVRYRSHRPCPRKNKLGGFIVQPSPGRTTSNYQLQTVELSRPFEDEYDLDAERQTPNAKRQTPNANP
ncbi:MAG: hypothetical protein WAM44_19735, partial [Chthoniobacterales bacterium]